MKSARNALRNIWEKNWPEINAVLMGSFPQFIFSRHQCDIGSEIFVFCYHVVDAKDFEDDLNFLSRNGYETVDADALLDHLAERRPAPYRSVVLSFDDGARNLYEVAFPLLERYGMKAVAFLSTRFHNEEFNHHVSNSIRPQMNPLNWSQIRRMNASGIIDFQSHTHEHRYIPRWPEPAGLEGTSDEVVHSLRKSKVSIEEDFKLSKEILEQKLEKSVRHLAFPCFNGTEQALDIGKSLGYEGFWWGVLPQRCGNKPGQSPLYITRVSGRYLRRLPGIGREPIRNIMQKRYGDSLLRFLKYFEIFIHK